MKYYRIGQILSIAIDYAHTKPQMDLDCGPGLWVQLSYPSVKSICCKYINICTICTIRYQHYILKTAVANVSKGQTDMSHKGEHQKLTKLSMRHQVSPSETCRTSVPLGTCIGHSL